MYNKRRPMSSRPIREKDQYSKNDKRTTNNDDGTGGKVSETNYSDGSSTVHFGGPVGDVNYDQYGNEC